MAGEDTRETLRWLITKVAEVEARIRIRASIQNTATPNAPIKPEDVAQVRDNILKEWAAEQDAPSHVFNWFANLK